MKIDIYADNPIISLEYMIAVMQAAKEGASIECRRASSHGALGGWESRSAPKWDWPNYQYHVKPVPSPRKPVPLFREELMSFRFARRTVDDSTPICLITSWCAEGIRIDGLFYTARILLEQGWELSKDGLSWWPADSYLRFA